MGKKQYSKGDYIFRKDAKTFVYEFYYINFLDRLDEFNSEYSEKIDNKRFAINRAKYLAKNSWALKHIDYRVEKIGVYSSKSGHIESFSL
jgi:hypothetical protein